MIGAATGEMLLPFIVSSLFGPGLDAVEEAAGEAKHASSGAAEAPGSPAVLMWVMLVAGLLNMGVWRLAVLRGRAVQDLLRRRAAARRGAKGEEGGAAAEGGSAVEAVAVAAS